MIPAFIQDLSLDLALAAYCPQVNRYILTSNKDEHVVDLETQKKSVFVTPIVGQAEKRAGKVFEVKNLTNKDFALLQIDHGLINTTATKKCDCAVLDDKDCAFVEFKTNAISTKTSTIKANYNKALLQLSITIGIFRNGLVAAGKNLDLLRNVEAYVWFKKGYRRRTASEGTYRVKFAAQNRCALYFEPKKDLK